MKLRRAQQCQITRSSPSGARDAHNLVICPFTVLELKVKKRKKWINWLPQKSNVRKIFDTTKKEQVKMFKIMHNLMLKGAEKVFVHKERMLPTLIFSPDISSVQAMSGSKFFALRKSKLYLLQKYAKKMAPHGLAFGEHFGYCNTVMLSV